MDKPRDRLVGVSVEGLFGRPTNLQFQVDNVCTILTGANGTGKSTLLRAIFAVASGQFDVLSQVPVRALSLQFANGPDFHVVRSAGTVRLTWGEQSDEIMASGIVSGLPKWAREVLDEAGFVGENAADMLMDFIPRGVGPEELIEVRRAVREITPADQGSQPSWYVDFCAAFPASFITDQRLLIEDLRGFARDRHLAPRFRAMRPSRAVEAVSRDTAERISSADMQYARVSQRIDKEFPQQVIRDLTRARTTSDDVSRLAAAVDEQRERLLRVGLIDTDASLGMSLNLETDDPHLLTVVASFLKSTQRKLNGLGDLAGRLAALKDFLDSMFVEKSTVLTREKGLSFDAGGRRIAANELSSGEQQMVVLAHKILFETQPGTLVIIDEPEISLHIRWQERLVDDLIAMGARSQLQFLMATHSPMVLGNHPEMERSLDSLAR